MADHLSATKDAKSSKVGMRSARGVPYLRIVIQEFGNVCAHGRRWYLKTWLGPRAVRKSSAEHGPTLCAQVAPRLLGWMP